jgi:glutamine cyclotransferase
LATDGTENIFIINPEDWSMLEKHRIKGFNGLYLTRLNELEIYENSILVNRWMTDIIFKLDLNTFELVK